MTPDAADQARRRARRVRWAVRIGGAVLRGLSWTWRVRQIGTEGWRSLRAAGRPWVFAVWHGDLLSAVAAHRGEGIGMLVSEHADGEIIARIGAQFGQTSIRGSTSRGGARALLGLVRALRAGQVVAITPDGPRGPRHVAQAGVAAAAERGGAPVVAIGVAYSRAWRLSSWDQFRVPLPFARVVLAYSAPIVIPDTTAESVRRVADAMEVLEARATAEIARG